MAHRRLFGVIGLAARNAASGTAGPRAIRRTTFLIDGPPRATAIMRSAMLASDLVLVSGFSHRQFDVWASHAVLDLVREAAPL